MLPPLYDDTTQTVFPTTTGGFKTGMLYGTEATTAPVAGSIRSSVLVFPIAYSEPSALTSEPGRSSWWSISFAPQGAPPTAVAGVVCSVEDDVWVGADEDELADEADPPAAAGGVWCELARTAMPALAPAMTTTAAAARAGAQARLRPRPPRRGRGTPSRG